MITFNDYNEKLWIFYLLPIDFLNLIKSILQTRKKRKSSYKYKNGT